MGEDLFFRRAVVLGSAVLYWAGVVVQARRVRKQIGRSPNTRPRGLREKLLWAGWFLVIVAWMGQPFVGGNSPQPSWLHLIPWLMNRSSLALGIVTMVAGYIGTLWCYAAMGNTWRMGVNRKEQTTLVTWGPYRFVRHPIYLFQVVMLAGMILLLPTPLSLTVLVVHLLCVLVKASDEESYLLTIHGEEYRNYLSRTGRLFPNGIRRIPPRE